MSVSRATMIGLSTLAAASLGLAAPAAAETAQASYSTFKPASTTNTNAIDYDVWDEALKKLVVSFGPSLRQTAGRAPEGFGTRRIYGHTSRYRLEGNRIGFSFLDATIVDNLAQYRQDLQAIAKKVDLQSLSRNEQLAFWMNLHNVAMVEKIGGEWPMRQPRRDKVNGQVIDDSKFIMVEGVALSPRDIREKIVYPNWKDPRVIYGFWLGDIGGPSIQRQAFTGENVSRLLNRSAVEFVNSLRGTQKLGSELQVSTLYDEVAPFYFPDFEDNVRSHLSTFANEDVAKILADTKKTDAVITEYDIADLAGGMREPSYSNVQNATTGRQQSFRIPRSMGLLLAQREEKFRRILKKGRTGTVTFSPLELPGEDGVTSEVE
ncbi:MAG: DUF547 domain-containing protein [Pseudomonadota bacterium]